MISNMSAEEMQETLQSFLSSMQDPNTLQLLQNRIARSSENEVHQHQEAPIHAKASSAVSESSKSPSNPLNQLDDEEKEARRIANEIDYSTILSEADLAAAVQKLPLSEKRKLEWTTPAQPSSSSSSSEPRFHFDGYILSASDSAQIDVYSGLYNHGQNADLPGYTLSELLLLCRSDVHGQRVLALKCLFNLLRRRSLARIAHQSLTPAFLPVSLLRVLVLLLQRRRAGEEVFLALRCLEEVAATQDEFRRFLLLNLTFHGYEHAHVQDSDAGSISPYTGKILKNALRLQNLDVSDIMLPRSKVVYLDAESAQEENIALAEKTRHTRYPLCKGDLDNCYGIVNIKNIFSRKSADSVDLMSICRETLRIKESEKLDTALSKMLKYRLQMALVEDEFGGIIGVITLDAALSELVGKIRDEFDRSQDQSIRVAGKNKYIISGQASLHRVEDFLDVDFDNDEVSTFGGLITFRLGRFPENGERLYFKEQNLRIQVEKVGERAILECLVQLDEQREREI